MQMEELHSTFSGLVGKYSQHREYIRRAQAQAHKFTSGVVQKVILDHEIQASKIADELLPLVPQLEALIADLQAQENGINKSKAVSDERFQELELRLAIGEMPDDEFEAASSDLRAELDLANARLSALEADRNALSNQLQSWISLAAEGGQEDGTSSIDVTAAVGPAPEPEPEPAPELNSAAIEEAPAAPEADEVEEEVSFDEEPEQVAPFSAPEELSAEEPEPVVSEDDGRYSSTGAFSEDVSAVYGGDTAPQVSEEAEPLEAADASVDFGYEQDDEPAPPEDEPSVEEPADEIGIDLDVAEEPAPPAESAADEGRRALLLYQEGTADEQIYPFTGEVLTIGRGRDNDIQIKNDSKVSRFHCKLFRRGANFYIEDNKSSNGTLVNGELITERRLFGGEEVIIGETYFRFRIM